MLHIPDNLLERLKCSICEGYLSSSPVVSKNHQNICAKCYKILPKDEQKACARQTIYESIAEHTQFPCRFKSNGCSHQYFWNSENGHEVECPFRNRPKLNNQHTKQQKIVRQARCQSENIIAELNYEVKEHQYAGDYNTLTYVLNIHGAYGKILSMQPYETAEHKDNVCISLEGVMMLKKVPEIIYTDIKLNPAEENHYESIDFLTQCCLKCSRPYENTAEAQPESTLCYSCKKAASLNNVDQLDLSVSVCKNLKWGCIVKIPYTLKMEHERFCKFNPSLCPIDKCTFVDTLENLRSHLNRDHYDVVIMKNELSKPFSNRDESIVFLCYDGIFKCSYYVYESYIEIFLMYIGAIDKTDKFTYEISVQENGKLMRVRRKCCTVNDVMLAKGVVFEKSEFDIYYDSEFNIIFNVIILST